MIALSVVCQDNRFSEGQGKVNLVKIVINAGKYSFFLYKAMTFKFYYA